MSSAFMTSHGAVFVSNKRFDSLVAFAIEVGRDIAKTPAETGYVERLSDDQAQMFPGYDLAIDTHFPEAAERRFWAAAFVALAARLESGTIGNPNPPHDWRGQAAIDAAAVAELFWGEGA